ncbi:MAG: transcriptional repressor [Candidatus Omnitrophica bacterium]|nr:transcriptional repressor [Candidatus Omnitrophota bacterium]MCB9747503.1 transcriptional repressor [Candidatus Omnitrophota bacterium]
MIDNQLIAKLKAKHIKITPKREAILQLFLNRECCFSPDQVWGHLRKQFKHCGLPSVYRNLELFAQHGVLTKIQKTDRRLYYALCKDHDDHPHYHMICVDCGRVEDVPTNIVPEVDKVKGFKILKHFYQAEGVCQQCAN